MFSFSSFYFQFICENYENVFLKRKAAIIKKKLITIHTNTHEYQCKVYLELIEVYSFNLLFNPNYQSLFIFNRNEIPHLKFQTSN